MVTCESQRATAVAEKFFSQFKLLAPLFQIFWQFSSSNTLVRDTVTIFISFYEVRCQRSLRVLISANSH